MELIEGLPKSGGKDVISVMVDRYTRYGHFMALSHPFITQKIAEVFLENIHRLHRLQECIVSDRDKIFTSHFWKKLFKQLGTKLNMSTTYHPQTDGLTERLNQTLEMYLRCFCSSIPRKWVELLSMIEWCYNTTYHIDIQIIHFEALYGYKPPMSIGAYENGSNVAMRNILEESKKIEVQLKENLKRSQDIMKQFANKGRTKRSLEVGDWVYLKLQTFRQTSVAIRKNLKTASKCYGRYEVEKRIGKVAYKLKFPAQSLVHPVIHISLLKKKLGRDKVVCQHLPIMGGDGQPKVEPCVVIDRRLIIQKNKVVLQWLIR